MTTALARYLFAAMSIVGIAACSGSYHAVTSDRNRAEIETHQGFLEWSAKADIGARSWLSGVTVRLWPDEYLLVFPGPGSSYERCLSVSLTDQQVREVRLNHWSINEDRLEVLIEISSQASDPSICTGGSAEAFPTLSVLRMSESRQRSRYE